MNASSIIRKSLVSATVAAALLSAGAALSAERFGRDSVYASAGVASSSQGTVVSQRQGRSSVYATDAVTAPRATAKVGLTPHVAGNGRGSVFVRTNGQQG